MRLFKKHPIPWDIDISSRGGYFKIIDGKGNTVMDDGSACGEYCSELSMETAVLLVQFINEAPPMLQENEKLREQVELNTRRFLPR